MIALLFMLNPRMALWLGSDSLSVSRVIQDKYSKNVQDID